MNEPEWIDDFQSSNIDRYRYHKLTEILEVQFRSGATYEYYRVPISRYDELNDAPSKGKYLSESIRDVYNYVRKN